MGTGVVVRYRRRGCCLAFRSRCAFGFAGRCGCIEGVKLASPRMAKSRIFNGLLSYAGTEGTLYNTIGGSC